MKILIFIAFVIFATSVAYTGLYFGFNAGFDKAKKQYSELFYSTAPKVKSPSLNRIEPESSKHSFQFANDLKFVQEAKRVIEKANRLKINQKS
ncbi:MAG: hypothetical protein OQK04_11800 [Kangiellaceae bacterium]|nr:hypothetical protein [Kangiellaceae bacterium]MCW8999384.1 hypothetical protein [Kangiellaceae bacterium]